ncbi:unnamed protein product [Linum tenue]|uniref:F-box domain-containing protein n=2 Tax=Linum tenue TaxID=586396 RepID=A0AAV0KU55_9ROSI|nr:unnamed protein product [Linum tenue]
MTNCGGSPWEDLPEEILEAIGSRIDHPINILNFRSVCRSWRSAVRTPDFHHPIPPIEVRLPYPGDVDGVLVPSIMCFVEFHPPPIPNGDSTFAVAGGWPVKIEEASHGKLQLVDPISNLKLRYTPTQLSLAGFRDVQLSSSFRLTYRDGFTAFEVNKFVVFPHSANPLPQQQSVTIIAIFHKGRIGYWRNGEEDWTPLDDRIFDYDDIIIHRGRYHVVDRFGKLFVIDSSLKFVEPCSAPQPPDGGGSGQKNLVESGGDLYLVDRYLDGRRRNWKDVEDAIASSFHPIRRFVGTGRDRGWNPRAVDFRVYKLDKEMGEWVEVNSLGGDDTVFVLTPGCCFR